MKALRRGAALIAAVAVLSACGLNEGNDDKPATDATLRIGTAADFGSLNPFLSYSTADGWAMDIMYPHLLRMDESAQKVPALAKSYDYSPDGLTATFHLRDDFKWSDGKPVTAGDVKFTAEKITELGLSFVRTHLDPVASIDTPDDTTVVFHLKRAYSPFAGGVGFWMPIVPRQVFEGVSDLKNYAVGTSTVGGGAFALSSAVKGQRYTFTANPGYPLGPSGGAAIKTVEYVVYPDVNTMQLALRNGDISMMATPVPPSAVDTLRDDKNVTIATVPSLGYSTLIYNLDNEKLRQVSVRKAISESVDVKSIIGTILKDNGKAVAGPVPPVFANYYDSSLTPYAFDPAGAKAALQSAGYKDGNGDGIFDGLEFDVLCNQDLTSLARAAGVIRDDAAKAGIRLNLNCVTSATWTTGARNGDYDVLLNQWGVIENPVTTLRGFFLSTNPGSNNYNRIKDPALDAKINDMISTVDDAGLQAKAKELAKVVYDDYLFAPIYVENFFLAYRSDRFKGFTAIPSNLLGLVTGYSLANATPVA